MKMNAKKLAAEQHADRVRARQRLQFRNIRSGISGASTRVSMTTNAASKATDAASSDTVLAVPQPACGAVETA